MSDVSDLIAEIRRIDRVASGYAIVELDLRSRGIPLGVVGEQANRVALEFDRAKKALAAAQSKCSHAYEKIGEAKPPFWRCVRCDRTRTSAP